MTFTANLLFSSKVTAFFQIALPLHVRNIAIIMGYYQLILTLSDAVSANGSISSHYFNSLFKAVPQ